MKPNLSIPPVAQPGAPNEKPMKNKYISHQWYTFYVLLFILVVGQHATLAAQPDETTGFVALDATLASSTIEATPKQLQALENFADKYIELRELANQQEENVQREEEWTASCARQSGPYTVDMGHSLGLVGALGGLSVVSRIPFMITMTNWQHTFRNNIARWLTRP